MGLIKAVEYFDKTRGYKFISYAIWCIRQPMIQAIAKKSNIKPIPLNEIGLIRKVNITYIKLEQYFHQNPRIEQIAAMLEFQRNNINDASRATTNNTYNLA